MQCDHHFGWHCGKQITLFGKRRFTLDYPRFILYTMFHYIGIYSEVSNKMIILLPTYFFILLANNIVMTTDYWRNYLLSTWRHHTKKVLCVPLLCFTNWYLIVLASPRRQITVGNHWKSISVFSFDNILWCWDFRTLQDALEMTLKYSFNKFFSIFNHFKKLSIICSGFW